MKIETLTKRNRNITIISILVMVFAIFCSKVVDFNIVKGISSVPKALIWLFTEFVPNGQSLSKISDIINKLIETILLSIAATTTAGILALIFGIMGSKVTRINGLFSTFSRFIASISRNVPDAVWAMVFLLSFGQNVLTGYFALFLVSFGVLTRAFIETMDESSQEVVLALEAAGASKIQIVFQGIIPSSISQMISWILYMIETNIRSSTLIGMLTGTGIGFMFEVYYKGMNYAVASLIVLSIIISIIIIEVISNKVRRVIL